MEVLYKYVRSNLVEACLLEVGDGTLRATQPAALNDPFECGVLPGNRRVADASNDEIAALLTSLNGTTPVGQDAVQQAKQTYGSLFLRELLAKQLSERFGIVSFAADPRHPLLWAHYTGDGSGFVIGYDKEQISALSHGVALLMQVGYRKRPIPIVVVDPGLAQRGQCFAALISPPMSRVPLLG